MPKMDGENRRITRVYVERRYGLRWKRIGTYKWSAMGWVIVTADHPAYWVAKPSLSGTAWYRSPEDREAWQDEEDSSTSREEDRDNKRLTNKESKVVTCYMERDVVIEVAEVTTTQEKVISRGEISEEWVS